MRPNKKHLPARLTLVVLGSLLSGCGVNADTVVHGDARRFEFFEPREGEQYLLDQATGALYLRQGSQWAERVEPLVTD